METSIQKIDEMQKHFVTSRLFDAPKSLVFSAFSKAENLAQWWGPQGCKITIHHLDFRPGGSFHYQMSFAQNESMWGKFFYKEIVVPESIDFVNCFTDAQGNIIRAPFNADWPLQVLTSITLTEEGNKTRLTLLAAPIHASNIERELFIREYPSMDQGFNGSFDVLANHLQQLLINN